MLPESSSVLSPQALPWLSSLDVGDERIDGEHRALMDCANDLCLLARAHPPPETLRRAGRELIALVEVHFESEESLFPLIGYTHRQSHVREHLILLDALHTLVFKAQDRDPPLNAVTIRLLLLEHILRHDLEFKTWVEEARRGAI